MPETPPKLKNMRVGHDEKGNVFLAFGAKVSLIAMTAQEAIDLGKALIEHAGAKTTRQ